MADVKLFKRNGTYTDKEGNEKKFTNFYVQCGDQLISVTPTYFENDEGRDPAYVGRKMVLSSYAEELPEKEKTDKPDVKGGGKKNPKLETLDDDKLDIPF